jgi:hypothetical protein
MVTAVVVCRTVRWKCVCGIIVVVAPVSKMRGISSGDGKWWYSESDDDEAFAFSTVSGNRLASSAATAPWTWLATRALLAAFACFVAASFTTMAASVVVAELTEGVNGCYFDAAVF